MSRHDFVLTSVNQKFKKNQKKFNSIDAIVQKIVKKEESKQK